MVSAKATQYNWGFFLTPRGGLDKDVYRDVNRVYHNSYLDFRSWRPQAVVDLDANWFRGDHEAAARLQLAAERRAGRIWSGPDRGRSPCIWTAIPTTA